MFRLFKLAFQTKFLGSCLGESVNYKTCFTKPCWSEWSDYSPCTTSCGSEGKQTRTRKCFYSYPVPFLHCEGNATETRGCNLHVSTINTVRLGCYKITKQMR